MSGIKDVAERAGVSTKTVSHILNGKHLDRVRDKTRERVLAAANELNYRPNPHARALVGGKAPLVRFGRRGSTTLYVSNLKTSQLLSSINDLDHEWLLADIAPDQHTDHLIDSLTWGQPEIVLLQVPTWDTDKLREICQALHAQGSNVIIADSHTLPPKDIPCDAVVIDRVAGTSLVAAHLVDLGHRRIGLLTPQTYASGRLEGYERVLSDTGIFDRFITTIDPSSDDKESWLEQMADRASAATQKLLQNEPSITALICASDMLALGAIRALQQAHLRIPEDMAVTGMHNEPWTGLLSVPLTSVEEPVDELCHSVKELLTKRLQKPDRQWQRITLRPRLVVRESTVGEADG